jgi:hypothetical protein
MDPNLMCARASSCMSNVSELTIFQVLQGSAAMEKTLHQASDILHRDGSHGESMTPKWAGFDSN